MTDKRDTMKELIGEMERLRERIAALELSIANNEHAQEAIRESEIRLRTAVESLPFDFFLIGPDGRYVMQNSACKRNWGDVVGKRPEDMCPDKHTWALWQVNNSRAFAGEVVEGEVAFEPSAGTRYCYNIISPIRGGDEIRGILGVNIDITARKQAEQALQRLNDELEKRVQDRTAQLETANRCLEAEMEGRRQVEVKLRESETQYRTLVGSAGESIVEQLFFSLVENAVQAADGREEHRLAIRGVVKDRVVELAFADDCGGIAPKHVGRIFEPFFTTKNNEKATGLGLCIIERVLRKIGGKVRVDNRPGIGVTFIITLPVDSKVWGTT